jgi:hypothetical protein
MGRKALRVTEKSIRIIVHHLSAIIKNVKMFHVNSFHSLLYIISDCETRSIINEDLQLKEDVPTFPLDGFTTILNSHVYA